MLEVKKAEAIMKRLLLCFILSSAKKENMNNFIYFSELLDQFYVTGEHVIYTVLLERNWSRFVLPCIEISFFTVHVNSINFDTQTVLWYSLIWDWQFLGITPFMWLTYYHISVISILNQVRVAKIVFVCMSVYLCVSACLSVRPEDINNQWCDMVW